MLAVGARLLANILLRAEQGRALVARGGRVMGPDVFRLQRHPPSRWLNLMAAITLLLLLECAESTVSCRCEPLDEC